MQSIALASTILFAACAIGNFIHAFRKLESMNALAQVDGNNALAAGVIWTVVTLLCCFAWLAFDVAATGITA